jgi:hypothetical protein
VAETSIPNAAVEAVASILIGSGAAPGNSIHSWRCVEDGCDCCDLLASDIVDFLRDAIHRDGEDADAIREALGLTGWQADGPFAPSGAPAVRVGRDCWADIETGQNIGPRPTWKRRVVGEWREVPDA